MIVKNESLYRDAAIKTLIAKDRDLAEIIDRFGNPPQPRFYGIII